MDYSKGLELSRRMHEIIPAGGHTYSKGDDQFPQISPKVIERAKGAYCWDVDGNRFIDWPMGNRVMILGHADPVVNKAVYDAIQNGLNFTRPGVMEFKLAEFLVDLWKPVAEMVKFGKNGSDVTTAAVKLSRAYTGRKYVAVCEEHPFFAIHDWFIGTTAINAGVIEEHRQHTLKFKYNDMASLERLVDQYPNQIACVILETVKNDKPVDNYLQKLRDFTTKHGIVLIFDENISGMRFSEKGAYSLYGVYPDLACFGKAIANGFCCSVLAGKRDILELGGIHHKKERVFLLSQTHGSETTGLTATLATIQEYQKRGVKDKVLKMGGKLKKGFREIAKEYGVERHFQIIGFDQNPQILCKDAAGVYWPTLNTLFHQYVIEKGVLIPWISITDSHSEKDLEATFDAIRHAIKNITPFVGDPKAVEKALVGSATKPVFRKFN